MGRPVKFKEAMYEAAARLFGEKGLDGTSIRDIASLAGVSEAALYRHWEGKLDLAWDVFLSGMTALHDKLEETVTPDIDAYEAVHGAIACFYRQFDENHQLYRFFLLHQHDLWSRMQSVERSPVTFWIGLMKRFAGALPPEDAEFPDVIAAVTLGIVVRPAVASLYGRPSGPMAPHSDLVARAVCRAMHIRVG